VLNSSTWVWRGYLRQAAQVANGQSVEFEDEDDVAFEVLIGIAFSLASGWVVRNAGMNTDLISYRRGC